MTPTGGLPCLPQIGDNPVRSALNAPVVSTGRDGSLNPPQLVDVAFGYGQPLRYLAGRAVAIMPLRRRRRTSLALRIIDPQTFPQEPRLFL